jgi:hypothetical protein
MKIHQAARSCNDDVRAASDSVYLVFVTGPADYRGASDVLRCKLAAKGIGLISKLARRRQDKHGRALLLLDAQILEYRQQKSCSFTGAGLGSSDYILAV